MCKLGWWKRHSFSLGNKFQYAIWCSVVSHDTSQQSIPCLVSKPLWRDAPNLHTFLSHFCHQEHKNAMQSLLDPISTVKETCHRMICSRISNKITSLFTDVLPSHDKRAAKKKAVIWLRGAETHVSLQNSAVSHPKQSRCRQILVLCQKASWKLDVLIFLLMAWQRPPYYSGPCLPLLRMSPQG